MIPNWLAVGLSQDLPAGVVMPAIWHGAELAVWRSAAGKLAAWNDRCPHRGMRLSHGFVRGETLSCIYHGWVYGTSGACSRIPAHPNLVPPATIKAEAYLCREQDGVIWVARDTTEAPPSLPGLLPLRSLSTRATPAQIAQALPALTLTNTTLRGATPAGDLCLILSPSTPGTTAIHALCSPATDKIAASRWLDGLRRRIEEGETV